MAPPSYTDLGKQARDLLTKNYHFGLIKLDVKTKTPTNLEFAVNGVSNNDTGNVNASLETKYNVKDYGLTVKEKWNTDNTLTTEATVEDQLVKGLKLGISGNFAPQSGKKSGTLKSGFKSDMVNANVDVDLDHVGSILHGAIVCGNNGWLAGAQMSFDPAKNALKRSNFAVGYHDPKFILHTNVKDGVDFLGSVYQRVNDQTESSISVGWNSQNNTSQFTLGCGYRLDGDTTLKARVNNSSQIGLGFVHRLRSGITLSLSGMIDGKNFNQGGHKLGLGLELDA